MKMLGKLNQPPCGRKCCGDHSVTHNRTAKRRERQNWKKEVSR